jgi:hypothetical protein
MFNVFPSDLQPKDEIVIQPSDGLSFYTYGHYGSTYFDPISRESLILVLCDVCTKLGEESGLITRRTE